MVNLNNYLKNIFDLLNKNEFDKALELCDRNTQIKFITNKTKVYKYENNFKDLKNDLQDYGINFEINE